MSIWLFFYLPHKKFARPINFLQKIICNTLLNRNNQSVERYCVLFGRSANTQGIVFWLGMDCVHLKKISGQTLNVPQNQSSASESRAMAWSVANTKIRLSSLWPLSKVSGFRGTNFRTSSFLSYIANSFFSEGYQS